MYIVENKKLINDNWRKMVVFDHHLVVIKFLKIVDFFEKC